MNEAAARVNIADRTLRDLLNLPGTVETSTHTLNYQYGADGTKLKKTATLSGSHFETEIYYAGNLVFRILDLESILVEGGYIDMTGGTPAYRFYVSDHQGNVRLVTDATGTPLQVNHYDPFGNELDMSASTSPVGGNAVLSGTTTLNPYKYSGKEWDDQASLYDFSARMYNPTIARFTTMDPLCEKYYSVSPYAYCAGNPVNLVDPSGESTWVYQNEDGTYTVFNGDLEDNDLNIYVYSKDSSGEYTIRGESIGITPTIRSFYNSDSSSWVTDAVIRMDDKSGREFMNYVVDSSVSLMGYMMNAIPNGIFDFKKTNGSFGVMYNEAKDFYRGMPIGSTANGVAMIASARDIGNMVAGYVAGIRGISWSAARTAFDTLELLQQKGAKIKEGISTQEAQKYGWSIGYLRYRKNP